jgi:hypothetical protein
MAASNKLIPTSYMYLLLSLSYFCLFLSTTTRLLLNVTLFPLSDFFSRPLCRFDSVRPRVLSASHPAHSGNESVPGNSLGCSAHPAEYQRDSDVFGPVLHPNVPVAPHYYPDSAAHSMVRSQPDGLHAHPDASANLTSAKQSPQCASEVPQPHAINSGDLICPALKRAPAVKNGEEIGRPDMLESRWKIERLVQEDPTVRAYIASSPSAERVSIKEISVGDGVHQRTVADIFKELSVLARVRG